MNQARIVIADESAIIRDELREAFATEHGLIAVGEATNGAQAFWLYHQLHPDVLILDLTMPRPSGLEVLHEIRKRDQDTTIIIFTADPALALRDACLKAGASFYFDKGEMDLLIGTCRRLLEE